MDLTEFNQRKKLVEDTINDNARRMESSPAMNELVTR